MFRNGIKESKDGGLEKGSKRRKRKITKRIYLTESFMEIYKLFVFVFWINAVQCVYMKQCKLSWF
jgi:hypothetical protein